MTNWMTAAGLALIAGGLATLICFRTVLFRPGRRRARGAARPAEAVRPRRGSRRRSASASGGQPLQLVGAPVGGGPGVDIDLGDLPEVAEDDRRGGLASLGLADEDDEELDDPDEVGADEPDEPDEIAEMDRTEEPLASVGDEPVDNGSDTLDEEFGELPAPAQRYGHRVEGWVRPEYHEVREEPPAGEYWTPIPVDLAVDHEPSAKGYGWPVPVERLPPVPSYEPATGFDLEPVAAEPTEALSSWSRRSDERAGQIRLPRSWAGRDQSRPSWPPYNEARPAADPARPSREDSTQLFATVQDTPRRTVERRRPRPRPRPEPPADRNTTVYVSRHAAEPPR